MVKFYKTDELEWLFFKQRMKLPFRKVRAFFRNLIWPHNVIKIKALPRSWVDKDEVMFHAMFQILCDFIEKEHPFDDIFSENKPRTIQEMRDKINQDLEDTNIFSNSAKSSREILALYEWYLTIRDDYHTLTNEEIAEMLTRLIKVRVFLYV